MSESDLRERVARALAIAYGRNPDERVGEDLGDGDFNTWPVWAEHQKDADAAIAIVLEEAARCAEGMWWQGHGNLATEPYAAAAQAGNEIASAIRALATASAPKPQVDG